MPPPPTPAAPAAIRLCAPPPFELWWVSLAGGELAGGEALLDDRERERAARFAFERDRHRHVRAHVGLRQLLAARTGRSAQALRFETGAFGKPRLRDRPHCSFSLSHSGDQALVALVDGGEIGVDLESTSNPLRDLDALARQCLGEREQFQFDATPETERELAFLRAWTRKEACLKALGIGLQVEPRSVETGLDASERQVRIHTCEGLRDVVVHSFVPMPGWVAALAHVR